MYLTHTLFISNTKVFPLFILWLLLLQPVFASQTVKITPDDINEIHFWRGKGVDIMEDKGSDLTIEDILSGKFDKAFTKHTGVTSNFSSAYWGRVKIRRETRDNLKWVFEAYDQSIDEIDFYAPDENGKYQKYEGGDKRFFSVRQYQHKNFVFDLNLPYGQEQTVYFRIKADHTVFFIGVVRNIPAFLGYALKEYFYLALFYGLVICLIIYNLMQYFVTRLNIYLVYVMYVFTAGLYSSAQDGLGYQFVWNALPGINNFMQHFSSFALISFALVLAYAFLRETNTDKKYVRIGIYLIGFRFLYMILSIYNLQVIPSFVIDIPVRIFILVLAISAYRSGYRQIRYFTAAISMLVLGYAIRELTVNGILPHTIFSVYAHLFGEALQMIFIALALSERIKIRMENMMLNQEKALQELELTNKRTEEIRHTLQTQVEEQVTREKYVSDGISELGSIITNYLNDTEELYKKISKFIARYFDCRITALYLIKPGGESAELVSGFGLDEIRLNGKSVIPGEGLLGQTMIDQQRIEIRDIPEEFISISSGLGSATPKLIILEPLTFNQHMVGILEMASFKEFTPLQYELLNKFTAQIASTLSNVMFNDTTRKMLEESRTKEEMLRQQEEEMRQQVEELIATQDEFQRREKTLQDEINSLKKKK